MRRHALQGDVDDNMRPVVRATQVRGTTDEALRGKWFNSIYSSKHTHVITTIMPQYNSLYVQRGHTSSFVELA